MCFASDSNRTSPILTAPTELSSAAPKPSAVSLQSWRFSMRNTVTGNGSLGRLLWSCPKAWRLECRRSERWSLAWQIFAEAQPEKPALRLQASKVKRIVGSQVISPKQVWSYFIRLSCFYGMINLIIRGIHPRTSQVIDDHCVHRGSTILWHPPSLEPVPVCNGCRRHAVSLVSKASPKPGVRCCSASFWPHLCYFYVLSICINCS